jgi:two-component system response regulator MtrA
MDAERRAPAAGGKGRILVVDDDAALSEMLTIVLTNEGFETVVCSTGDAALSAFRESRPDVVLLDLMLPGMDGIDVCRLIRAESGVPIVMLTAKTDTVDVVVGLESGADDYMVKPFKPKELVARIRARLRRFDDASPEVITIGDLEIDVAGHSVTRAVSPSRSLRWSSTFCCAWPASRGRSSPGRSCSSRSGGTAMPPTPGW